MSYALIIKQLGVNLIDKLCLSLKINAVALIEDAPLAKYYY